MIPEERQQRILSLLRVERVLSIKRLTELIDVSHMTVRRDLATLEEQGLVETVHGGVRANLHKFVVTPTERQSRENLNLNEKVSIAKSAGSLVNDGFTVFLDAGTTCEAVINFLVGKKDILVVTNDFGSIEKLSGAAIPSIHTGGTVDYVSGSSTGSIAASIFEHVMIDVAFLSTGAWGMQYGLTTSEGSQVELKRAVLKAADKAVLLADSSKFGIKDRYKVCPLTDLDLIITDSGLPDEGREALQDMNIAVSLT